MGIGIGGLISGLDTESIITQMMDIERRPIVALQKDEAFYQTKITSLGTLKGALASLQAALLPLQDADNFISLKASSGNTEVLTVKASDTAATGQYQVEVTGLAQAQQVRSSSFTASNEIIGTGTLTIKVGSGTAVNVTIDTSSQTLAGIASAINKVKPDVNATVVDDGFGNFYLTLASKNSGSANTISMTMVDADGNSTDASGLSSLYTTPATSTLTQTQAAANAELTVNGMPVERAENTIDDLIEGLTLTLKQEDPGNPFTIDVTEDLASVTTKVQAFVDQYNALTATINELQSYNAKTGESGILLGDNTTRQIQNRLKDLLYSQVDGLDDGLNRLSRLGIQQDRYGKLSLNSSTLTSALENNREDVTNFFSQEETGNNGIAHRFGDLLESYIKSGGSLASKEASLKSTIEDIKEQVETIEFRVSKKEETLRMQYENLEILLANFEATSGALEGQLQSLSALTSQIYKK